MTKDIYDPITFEKRTIEIDDLQNDIAIEMRENAIRSSTGPSDKLVTGLVYEEGSIRFGMMFRGQGKKFRVIIEEMPSE